MDYKIIIYQRLCPKRFDQPNFRILDLKEKEKIRRPQYFNFSLKNNFLGGGVFSFGGGVRPTPQENIINLPRTYENLPCKGEPDRFSG